MRGWMSTKLGGSGQGVTVCMLLNYVVRPFLDVDPWSLYHFLEHYEIGHILGKYRLRPFAPMLGLY